MDSPDVIWCNNSFIPDSDQYREALGSFSSAILIIGGLVTLGLFILCFEQLVYTNQTAHSGCKRHIYWVASVFPMMTLMSLVALLIPRSHNVCLSVKMVYMSIGISHFTDLTIVMFGGEERMLEVGREDTFSLNLSPVCCCCKCLPFPPVTKYSLRLVVLLTDQLPFIQAIYYVVVMILISADNITLGDVNPAGAFLWLNLVKFASVMSGVYGFMILSNFSRRYLHGFQYRKKALSIHVLVLVTNLQLLVFNIMGNYNAFPCIPPYVSSTVYKQTVDNSLYILEMMILGPYTYWQYHDLKFASPITHQHIPDSRSSSITHSSIVSGSSNEDSEHTITTTATSSAKTDFSSGGSGDSRRTHSTNDSTRSRGGSRSTTNGMDEKENGAVHDCEKGDCVITTQVSSIMGTASAGNKRKKESRSRSHSRDGSGSRVGSSGKKKSESARKKPKSATTQSKPKGKKTTTLYDLNETSETTNTQEKTTKSIPVSTSTFTTQDKGINSIYISPTSKTFTSVSLCPGMLNRAMSLSQPNMKARSEYERLY
ncbi:organic solute transporter subunit alpha-like [Eriocheir sinensis]|uniref:organic solute transporter subunit alpha-like n=1 Tax=Eriocheir sinensis TaxID=95602 RepID=UPI0021CA9B45|nr:organic solute transporter subunit alpha-like [Eriocheir sinensis]XP_050730286.1 organic solute transporter subunit alpha-like [Eriocheir sinensis]XP_050730287.1 organic solute transporter subunit alpha-like [Eriocheir sinensis]